MLELLQRVGALLLALIDRPDVPPDIKADASGLFDDVTEEIQNLDQGGSQ